MARASEQFRQSDVSTWGIVALVLGGIAVMGANVSALIPPSVLAGLHKTRIEGASLEQLRGQVAELRDETLRLKRENGVLAARFALEEQDGKEVVRRVGALEVTLPRLLENMPDNNRPLDRNTTAAIGQGQALIYDADGGSVLIRQQPMAAARPSLPDIQPLPLAVEDAPAQVANIVPPNNAAFGVALGPPIAAAQAPGSWQDLSMKLGPLLFGLVPMLADTAGGDDKRIVVGPISQLSEATSLCARLEQISVSCLPMPYTGTPLSF
ncbi:hypothetical protein [Devosia sp. 2618]|uniref:hypothetical protein n=1 Tax=Devosia sp. 2618 TaxID=3156454 RepID=UPI0033934D6D